jgi:hypothetical protein
MEPQPIGVDQDALRCHVRKVGTCHQPPVRIGDLVLLHRFRQGGTHRVEEPQLDRRFAALAARFVPFRSLHGTGATDARASNSLAAAARRYGIASLQLRIPWTLWFR